MIQKLRNKMMIGGVVLGVIGATALAGGVANADPSRDGRRVESTPAVRMERRHRLHRHHHSFNAVRRDRR